jgi:hypothetical protein
MKQAFLDRIRVLNKYLTHTILIHPEFIDNEVGVKAFPPLFRTGLRKMGVKYYLRLEIQQ